MNVVVIVAACRTAIGRHGGALKNVSALDLTIPVMRELIMRSRIESRIIEDVELILPLDQVSACLRGKFDL